MKRELKNKRAIVTGASSGIGRAIAEALLSRGAKVAAVSRSSVKLETKGDLIPIRADLAIEADRTRIVQEATAGLGGLDLLINVAGIGAWGHFATSTEDINRQILEVNFFAPLDLIRLAVPHLQFSKSPMIVNLTSMTGRRGMPAWPEYSASKAALTGMTEALRGEMVRFGIDTLTVVPGLTRTALSRNLLRSDGRVAIPYDKGMEPSYVAERTLDAIRRGRTEITLGSEARKILFLNRWAPRLLNRLIAQRVTREYR